MALPCRLEAGCLDATAFVVFAEIVKRCTFSSRVPWLEDAVKFAVLHFMVPY